MTLFDEPITSDMALRVRLAEVPHWTWRRPKAAGTLFLAVLLQALDGALTAAGLGFGAVEGNPFVRLFLTAGPAGLVGHKILCITILLLLNRVYPRLVYLSIWPMAAICTWNALVLAYLWRF